MKMFDHHIHMTSRTTDDYEAMAKAGIVAVIEPAFWMGQPRTHVGAFEDYFLSLIGWERFRAKQFVVLSRFSSGLFRAMFAMKEIKNGNKIHGRVSA